MTRAEKVAEAQGLHARGITGIEIAARMGVSRSTAYGYLEDPDLSRQRARRERYRGSCVDCGALTDGSGGFKGQRTRCDECHKTQTHTLDRSIALSTAHPRVKVWSDDELLWAVREGDRRGLDSTSKWTRAAEIDLPSLMTIVHRFGTWNRARELAGFTPRPPRRSTYPCTTANDCVAAVALVWRALGSAPSTGVYRGYRQIERPDLPSVELIRVRCGGWTKALRLADATLRASA